MELLVRRDLKEEFVMSLNACIQLKKYLHFGSSNNSITLLNLSKHNCANTNNQDSKTSHLNIPETVIVV